MKTTFKKIVLASALICFFSCSNESDVVTSDQNRNAVIAKSGGLSQAELDEAIIMYDEMLATNEYKTFSIALKQFHQNLVVEGLSFKSKDEAMQWINSNLSNTKFTSIGAFETDLDNLMGAMGNIMANNKGLFNHLSNGTGGQVFEIVKPEPPTSEYPPVTNSCQQGCIDTYEAGEAAALADYHDAIDLDFQEGDGSDIWNLWEAWEAARAKGFYDEAINKLVNNFNICIGGCGGWD